MVTSSEADSPTTVPRPVNGVPAATTDRARAVIAFHIPTSEGFCGGCLAQWARLAPANCESVLWARDVLALSALDSSALQAEPSDDEP